MQRLFGAAPQSWDPLAIQLHGPRISSAPRRKGGALRSIRGTLRAENSAAGASIAGTAGPFEVQKDAFLLAFHDGTAFADTSAGKVKRPRYAAFVGVLPC
jgi:hypothetical protein